MSVKVRTAIDLNVGDVVQTDHGYAGTVKHMTHFNGHIVVYWKGDSRSDSINDGKLLTILDGPDAVAALL